MSASKIIAELNAMLATVKKDVHPMCMFCKYRSTGQPERLFGMPPTHNNVGICHICALEMCKMLMNFSPDLRKEVYKLVDASKNEHTE